MVVERGLQRQLVIYWFQAGTSTASDTFWQKVKLVKEKIVNKNEANAFVRVSIPIVEGSKSKAMESLLDFIRAFYPSFLAHMNHDSA
jgi:EpsI family protein